MRFSWIRPDLLAPLLVPVIFSAALLSSGRTGRCCCFRYCWSRCIVSYGTTIFLFLPCLFLLFWRPMTSFKVCLLGLEC